MARRKLTKQQQNRINQQPPEKDWQKAQIVARYGKTIELRDLQNKKMKGRIPGKLQGNTPVSDLCVGDWVYLNPETNFVESLCPRSTQLIRYRRPTSQTARSASHQSQEDIHNTRGKVVAANITQVCIVIAPKPFVETLTIDEYLLAAEMQGFRALIISNKSDLPEAKTDEYQAYISDYKKLGYELVEVSTKNGQTADLLQMLESETSVFLGTSGVGKSSLLNALVQKDIAAVGEISTGADLGKHTTTTARLYELPTGGNVIDSPGIREFKLAYAEPTDLCKAYSDLYDGKQCQYSNCTHREEPNCAVKEARQNNLTFAWRYQNYLTLYTHLVEGII